MDGSLKYDAAPPPDTCRNCGAHATGHFCPNCGQETRVVLPTFAAFMREAAGRYVAMDGRLWSTLFALVARPDHLTREYLNGRRRRYMRPALLPAFALAHEARVPRPRQALPRAADALRRASRLQRRTCTRSRRS